MKLFIPILCVFFLSGCASVRRGLGTTLYNMGDGMEKATQNRTNCISTVASGIITTTCR